MAYKKPQYPLKNGDNYIYPPTTGDQVILSDGSRLEKNGEIIADRLKNKINVNQIEGEIVASKLSNEISLSLTGDVVGSAKFNGSKGVAISTTVSAAKHYTATLSSSGWSSSAPYTQTVSVSGIKSTDNPIVDINMSSATSSNSASLLEAWALVGRVATADGKITAYCYDKKPTTNIVINLMVVK